jgi:hypothetical protein
MTRLLTSGEHQRRRDEHSQRTMTVNGVPLYVLADVHGKTSEVRFYSAEESRCAPRATPCTQEVHGGRLYTWRRGALTISNPCTETP